MHKNVRLLIALLLLSYMTSGCSSPNISTGKTGQQVNPPIETRNVDAFARQMQKNDRPIETKRIPASAEGSIHKKRVEKVHLGED